MSPKVPRDVKPQQMIRILKKYGWYHSRANKHQYLFKHRDFEHFIIVPSHSTLKTGTTQGIIKAIGITLQEFLDNL